MLPVKYPHILSISIHAPTRGATICKKSLLVAERNDILYTKELMRK